MELVIFFQLYGRIPRTKFCISEINSPLQFSQAYQGLSYLHLLFLRWTRFSFCFTSTFKFCLFQLLFTYCCLKSQSTQRRGREFDLPLLPSTCFKKKLLAIKCPNEHDAYERRKGRNQIGSMAWIQRTVALAVIHFFPSAVQLYI